MRQTLIGDNPITQDVGLDSNPERGPTRNNINLGIQKELAALAECLNLQLTVVSFSCSVVTTGRYTVNRHFQIVE